MSQRDGAGGVVRVFAGGRVTNGSRELDRERRTVAATLLERRPGSVAELIEPGAFAPTLAAFLDTGLVYAAGASASPSEPIAVVIAESLELDEREIRATLEFPSAGSRPLADQVWAGILDGILEQVAIGIRIREVRGGRGGGGPLRVTRADLVDVALIAGASLGGTPDGPDRLLDELIAEIEQNAWPHTSADLSAIADELDDLESAIDELRGGSDL